MFTRVEPPSVVAAWQIWRHRDRNGLQVLRLSGPWPFSTTLWKLDAKLP